MWGREASALLALDEHENHVDMIEQDKIFHSWPDVRNPTKVAHLHQQGTCRKHAGVIDGNGNVNLWGQNECGKTRQARKFLLKVWPLYCSTIRLGKLASRKWVVSARKLENLGKQ